MHILNILSTFYSLHHCNNQNLNLNLKCISLNFGEKNV